MNSGVLCISWDTELLWGRKDLNWQQFVPRVQKEREVINNILLMLKKYEIPSTWAVVGKMWEKGDPDWYGPDIVKMIKSTPLQEIGSHSLSHEIFNLIDKKTAKKEMHNPRKLKSFVFPRNKINYLDILNKEGFQTFRGTDIAANELLKFRLPPVHEPIVEQSLVNNRGSMYLVSGRGLRKFIPYGVRFWKCRLGIDRAIREKKVFHIWTHPIDLVDDQKKMMIELENICKYANQERSKGKLAILTMEEVAKEILKSQ